MKKNMQCQGLKHLHLNFSTVFGDHCNILLKIVAIIRNNIIIIVTQMLRQLQLLEIRTDSISLYDK